MTSIKTQYAANCSTGYCAFPSAVSGHAYGDVDDSYESGNDSGGTKALVTDSSAYLYGTPVWITEAGVVQSQTGSLQTNTGLATGCLSGSTHSDKDPNDKYTISACVDDNGVHQAEAAQGFLNLLDVSGVQAVFYYGFSQNYNYDDALVADDQPNGGGNCPAGNVYPNGCNGQPRPSFCILSYGFTNGFSASQCAGLAAFTDTHSIAGSTDQNGREPAPDPNGVACAAGTPGAGQQSCCVIGNGGTGFSTISVTDDDWMDLEQGLAAPCFRQTGGQGL